MSFRGWQKITINTPNGTVEGIAPVIISVSRATDIPAFYADWFMHRLRTDIFVVIKTSKKVITFIIITEFLTQSFIEKFCFLYINRIKPHFQ